MKKKCIRAIFLGVFLFLSVLELQAVNIEVRNESGQPVYFAFRKKYARSWDCMSRAKPTETIQNPAYFEISSGETQVTATDERFPDDSLLTIVTFGSDKRRIQQKRTKVFSKKISNSKCTNWYVHFEPSNKHESRYYALSDYDFYWDLNEKEQVTTCWISVGDRMCGVACNSIRLVYYGENGI